MGIFDFKNALIAECASDCSDLRAHRRSALLTSQGQETPRKEEKGQANGLRPVTTTKANRNEQQHTAFLVGFAFLDTWSREQRAVPCSELLTFAAVLLVITITFVI
jgi:hypothetical protein